MSLQTRTMQFSHEVDNQLSQPKELCEIEFRGGCGSCPKKQNCNESHEFDYRRGVWLTGQGYMYLRAEEKK